MSYVSNHPLVYNAKRHKNYRKIKNINDKSAYLWAQYYENEPEGRD